MISSPSKHPALPCRYAYQTVCSRITERCALKSYLSLYGAKTIIHDSTTLVTICTVTLWTCLTGLKSHENSCLDVGFIIIKYD